jgi:uncharacterized protein
MSEKWPQRAQSELQFNVAQLLKEVTGGTRNYEISAPIMGEFDEETVVVAPLEGHVKFLRTGPNVLVSGFLHTSFEKTCGRCLITYTTPVEIELEEEFYPLIDINTGNPVLQPEGSDSANQIDAQNILSLAEVVRQELIVENDSVLYCQPDCKGLCPICGQDRNVGTCDCQDDQIDARWAGLLAQRGQGD